MPFYVSIDAQRSSLAYLGMFSGLDFRNESECQFYHLSACHLSSNMTSSELNSRISMAICYASTDYSASVIRSGIVVDIFDGGPMWEASECFSRIHLWNLCFSVGPSNIKKSAMRSFY